MSQLDTCNRIHIVGLKGAGTSALACILRARGKQICGSDVDENFFTDVALVSAGITVEHFSDNHIIRDPLECVIYSTAWKDSPEVMAARARGLLVLSYSEALGEMFNALRGIAVAGSHGKTTSTAMMTHVLSCAGHDPTAVIGSVVSHTHTNARIGKSYLMVIEADEYENKFVHYDPRALLITNIDYDHPDYFRTVSEYDQVFFDFIKKVLDGKGVVAVDRDDEGTRRVCADIPSEALVWYGADQTARYRFLNYYIGDGVSHYTLMKEGVVLGDFSLNLFGSHNVSNALGVIALCDAFSLVDPVQVATMMESFEGTARRFEYRGTQGRTRVYDDFAHHPTEIRATLEAARALYPDARIWCVFGAHTFSRTRTFLEDFSESFVRANHVLILDIYGSAREQDGSIHAADLAHAIQEKSRNAQYVGTPSAALAVIRDHIDEIDVLITMGAGDVWRIAHALIHKRDL